MIARTKTTSLCGIDGICIDIETDIAAGLPYFTVIGLADASVKESSERVKKAIINSGFGYPKGRITVNLTPAYLHKRGSHYDLAIAVGILTAMGLVNSNLEKKLFIGELSLDGRILPVKAVLPMIAPVMELNDTKIEEIIMPLENCPEGSLIVRDSKTKLIPVKTLREVIEHLTKQNILPYENKKENDSNNVHVPDFSDIKGHVAAKEAIITAIAGEHSLLMIGAPGTGKTMLASRITSVLPHMSMHEQLETSKIYSYAGKLTKENPIIRERPFRHVRPEISRAALLGGGNYPMPGELSFAHNGVLFADEMLELSEKLLESLRIPLEEKTINIIRRGISVNFPADFIFVGAANPCRCGYLGDSTHDCTCTANEIATYRSRLSGPLADRIDICIEINRVEYRELQQKHALSSEEMRNKIEAAKFIQKERFKSFNFASNGKMEDKYTEEFCNFGKAEKQFLKETYKNKGISPRRYYKILKVARTIADIKEEKNVKIEHIAAAFHYTRCLENSGTGRNN